jgi:hypothetical protein
VLALQGVVDVVGGGDVGLAAGEGLGDAEEADEVCAVGMEVLSGDGKEMLVVWFVVDLMVWVLVWHDVLGVSAVDAHFVLLRGIFAEVFDVA